MDRHTEMKAIIPKKTIWLLSCLLFSRIHSAAWAVDEQAEQIFLKLNEQFSSVATKDQQFGQLFLLIIAGAVMVFVIWVAYQLLIQSKEFASPETPQGIYKKLCRVHNLSIVEKHVLRKVGKQTGLDDPLPLFVEPKYFRQVLEDEDMSGYRNTIHKILQKLFGYQQEQLQVAPAVPASTTASEHAEATDVPTAAADPMTVQAASLPDVAQAVVSQTDEPVATEEENDANSQEPPHRLVAGVFQPSVTLTPIAGRAAFSTLVEPVHRISSEIAATSIRHNLADGAERNQRTFDGSGESSNKGPQNPQLPLFPKSKRPTPEEMLASQPQRTDQKVTSSPTPQYLQQRGPQSKPRDFPAPRRLPVEVPADPDLNVHTPKPGEVLTLDDVTLLETLVMGK